MQGNSTYFAYAFLMWRTIAKPEVLMQKSYIFFIEVYQFKK